MIRARITRYRDPDLTAFLAVVAAGWGPVTLTRSAAAAVDAPTRAQVAVSR
jgi:hypothetical protein